MIAWFAKDDRLVFTKDTTSRLSEEGNLAADKDDAPQTFRDAIVLVHRLGFKNLRVGTLCIQKII